MRAPLLYPSDPPAPTMHPSDDETDLHSGSWGSRLWEWSLRPRILGALTLAMLFVVVIPAVPSLWPAVSQRAKFQVSVDRIDLTPVTGSIPQDIVQTIAKNHPDWKDRSLLEANLAADLAAAFARHPWIAHVDRVEKTRQGRVAIQVTYRIPVAMVETHGGLCPIDAHGILLPSKDISVAESDQLPHLQGVRSLPGGPAGTAWKDPLVIAGAKLCAALTPQGDIDRHWNKYGIEAVVAPFAEDTDLLPEEQVFELLTKKGRRIIWGRSPGADTLEPTVAQKLGRLDSYIRQQKSLDLPAGSYLIDIRGFDATRLIAEKPGTGILR